MITLKVKTRASCEFYDLTPAISEAVAKAGIAEGICHIYIPHTTCAVTINENADPDVKADIIKKLNDMVSNDFPYSHAEGNSPAHIKAALLGHSSSVFIQDNRLRLGTWQGIFLCEFDGPRTREVWLRIC